MRSTLVAVLLAALAALEARAQAPVIRSLTLSVYTKKAEPVSDLRPDEVVVSEGGRKPAVLGLEPDRASARARGRRRLERGRRLELPQRSRGRSRSTLEGAAADATVAVWTTGPPSKVVDFGTALAEAEPRLQSIAPAGKNYAFDAMLDASRALGSRPSERRALVYVGGLDIEASRTRTAEAQQAMGQALLFRWWS